MQTVKRVLIIDDDEDDLFLIEDRLSQFVSKDCQFITCREKSEAVRLLSKSSFDLCVLDHHLGPFDGIEILEEVSNFILSTPIVMLTGQDDDEIAKLAIKKGAQDFVMKSSIDDIVFEKSIRYAVSRKELEFSRYTAEKIEAENVSKDRFIAHLSHELRTPLTSILGYTSLLLENDMAAPLNKELSIISNNGKHLLNLLNDVLDLSKIAAGKFELNIRNVDLEALMAEINSLLSVSAIDKGLELKFRSITPLPKMVYTDDMRLRQVLVNIIGNAIKFTDTGEIRVALFFEQNGENSQLRILVRDTGIGMSEQQTKEIFAPFKQLEDVTNRRAGGAGLGLSITNELVKQMSGKLKVDSKEGEGTTFHIELPMKYDEQDFIKFAFELQNDNYNPVKDKAPRIDGNILIVDDLFEIRQLAGFFVKETGATVSYAKNGKETVDLIANMARGESENSVDLILLDLHMPIMTGNEAIIEIRRINPRIPIIAMTAAMQKGLEEELFRSGFSGVITKPINKFILWKNLRKFLRESARQAENDHEKKLVHLVEDDVDSAAIMEILLKRLNYKVKVSSTGEKAINAIRENADAAYFLVDLGLPDMEGDKLLGKINEVKNSGRVIILSGTDPNQSLMKQHNIYKHLTKPISFSLLKSSLI